MPSMSERDESEEMIIVPGRRWTLVTGLVAIQDCMARKEFPEPGMLGSVNL